MLRYKCLLLDHDDTVVQSTPNVHYPAFCRFLAKARPDVQMSLNQYIAYNASPGFNEMCRGILGFTDEEMAEQESSWLHGLASTIPPPCPGIGEVILRQKEEGGYICVVSHSHREYIERDYRTHFGILPDLVYGWEAGEGKRKPDPFPLLDAMRELSLSPSEMLMVDDLKPGCDMAHFCGVEFAFAGWSATAAEVDDEMRRCSDYILRTVDELGQLLFGEDERMSWHRKKYL